MVESRGKKAKKATDWKLRLGIKELVFAGLGVSGLVMMSFALGTLAGRGDIYRVMHNWGLIGPDSSKTGQIWYQAPSPAPAQVVALASPPAQEPDPAVAVKPGLPQAGAPPQAPVKAIITPAPHPVQAKKKSPKQDAKPKEDKLDKIRQDVAKNLRFQNSLDMTATRAAASGDKAKKGADKEPPVAVKAPAAPTLVAKFRDATQARARLAQMQKQGEKVSLKEGKDHEGQYYAICRQAAPSPGEPHRIVQAQVKKPKADNKTAKPAAAKPGASR
jgi:hypothetical protein